MSGAAYKRDAECSQCLEFRRLLLPVLFHLPGVAVTFFLCLDCRLSIDPRQDLQHCCCADYHWRHLPAVAARRSAAA